MSWIDKELKRRAQRAAPAATTLAPDPSSQAQRMTALWRRLQAANEALPAELRLQPGPAPVGAIQAEGVSFIGWLRAPNGAALGFAGDAIRYLWPLVGARRSNNFWIRWEDERGRYVVLRRVGGAVSTRMAEYRTRQPQVERMIKCLVMGRRIAPRAVGKKRFWVL